MKYTAEESQSRPGMWKCYAVDHATGEILAVLFTGPKAQQRAEDYRDWMNGEPARLIVMPGGERIQLED